MSEYAFLLALRERTLLDKSFFALAHGLELVLQAADVVSIRLRLSDESREFIDAEHLALMKRDAILINTSRGVIVDEVALRAARRGGALGRSRTRCLRHRTPSSR